MSKSEEAMHGITFKDKIGYAMGDMGGLLTFGLVSAFLNMFLHGRSRNIRGAHNRTDDSCENLGRSKRPYVGFFYHSRKPTKYGRFRPYITLGISAALR